MPDHPASRPTLQGKGHKTLRHGGDHVLLVVRVEVAASTSTAPLIYARRLFGTHLLLTVAHRPRTPTTFSPE